MEKILGDKEFKIVIAIIAVGMLLFSFPTGVFVGKDVAIKAAETQGFTELEVTKKAIFFVDWLRGGGKKDVVRFTVTGINSANKRVEFYVYSGWLRKGATIRTK